MASVRRRAAGILVLTAAVAAQAQFREDAYEEAMRAAIAAVRATDWARALEGFEQALAARPGDATAGFNAALCHVELGQWDEARLLLEAVVKAEPMHAKAVFFLGVARIEVGDPAGAVASFRRAVELSPENVQAHYNLAKALDLSGSRPEARRILERLAGERSSDAPTLALLGTLELRDGELALAARHLSRAVELSPRDFLSHYHLGEAYVAMRQFEKAEPHFQQALELKPDAPRVHLALARMHADKDDYGRAEESFRQGAGPGRIAGGRSRRAGPGAHEPGTVRACARVFRCRVGPGSRSWGGPLSARGGPDQGERRDPPAGPRAERRRPRGSSPR